MPLTFALTLEKIEQSQGYINFKKQHEDAELCAGFFVIDYISGDEGSQKQLDYCLPDGKIFTFILNKEITIKEAEIIEGQEKQKLTKISREIRVDLDDVEKILESEMQTRGLKQKINKIIAVLQNQEGREIWNLNCILERMEILQAYISCDTGEILKFERKSMFDFIKKIK